MSRIIILRTADQKRFDAPPSFNFEERTLYFSLNKEELAVVTKLKTPESKIGFVLQLGYFKSHGKFFATSQFRKYDIDYVARSLRYTKSHFHSYERSLSSRHRKQILALQTWAPFDEFQREKVIAHINWIIQHQIVPRKVFLSVIDFCWVNKIEVPSYHTLSIIITDAYNDLERSLVEKLAKNLTAAHREKLKDLLSPSKPFRFLKKISQSVRPMDVKDSVEEFKIFYEYFNEFKKPMDALNLSDQATEYFGTWVQKALVSQLKSFTEDKMALHVLCYIKNRLHLRNDFLLDIFLKAVQSTVNKAKTTLNVMEKETRAERNQAIKKLSFSQKQAHEVIKSIGTIVNTVMSDKDKLNGIKKIIKSYTMNEEELESLTKILDKVSDDHVLFDALESLSLRLQRKVIPILKVLKFNPHNSDPDILKALDHFVVSDGNVGNSPLMSFMTAEEQAVLYTDKNKLRTSLYKCLLCLHIADGVKSGRLNLIHSYRYKSIDEYLIDIDIWNTNSETLLKSADLLSFKNPQSVLNNHQKDLEDKYKAVNETLLNDKNIYLKINSKDRIQISTPKASADHEEYVSSLLTHAGYVPIIEMLQDINQVAQFTEEFEHFSIKHTKMKPTPLMILAGLIGKGCNIGIRKIANISKGINEDKLKNIVTWCFSLKNIEKANNKILQITNKLSLANLYRHSPQELHTGSDGCKMNVRPDSIFGSYSYKYFGKGKGVSIYTFLDERNLLFHSTVLTASAREAAYVIDGLLQNDVLRSTIHSTDTHGFTECIFAGMHFIGITFAPRIKNIADQRLYSFTSKSVYEKKGYKILPSRIINSKLIEEDWDGVLRFMATIKLKHTAASQLFKRLSSYAKDNPLYKAIKEFGRVIKTSFILTYLEDVILRQRIEKQLNKVELSNKFSRAVFFANNQEFKCGTKEEQEIAVACKVLIQNAIVLWNYLYISQLLANNQSAKDRKEMIELLKKSSMMAWQHMNFHGEYDFTRYAANKNIPFNMEAIMNLKVS